MYKEERRQKILAIIETHGQVDVKELSTQFEVSEMTIRRDLQTLYEQGKIERTHGGALAPRPNSHFFEPPMLSRINANAEDKRLLASAVVKMIGPGEKIYLSSGSTTYWIARALLDRSDLTVMVNSLIIANVLSQSMDMVVIVIGGSLRRSELSLVGKFTEDALKNVRVDKVIMGVRGIDPEYGVTSDNPQEMMIDRVIMGLSDNVIVVTDHKKIGHVAATATAPITAARTIVTTRKAPADIIARIRAKGVEVIQV